MRVLTFTSLFPNKIQPQHGIFVQQRVSHLARRGHLVEVVAPVPYVPRSLAKGRWRAAAEAPGEERTEGLNVYHPRYVLLPRISMPAHGWLMYRGSVALAEKLHARHQFDCIDAHYVYPDGFAAMLVGRRLGLPVIVSARGTDINLFPSFRLIRPQIRWTLAQAAGAISVSDSLRIKMSRLGIPAEKIRTIGNGIDETRFSMMPRTEARRRLGIPLGARLAVSVGALVPGKRHDRLIPAMVQLQLRYPDLRLYIIGEGPTREGLQALIERGGLQNCVHLAGARPNEALKEWYNAADVSCLASSREGWPNVLLESLACGTPVVATRVGGVEEVIQSPELGVVVEQDIASIARGVELAIEKTWDREALVRYARSRTWDTVAEEVEEFLHDRVRTEAVSSRKLASSAGRFV